MNTGLPVSNSKYTGYRVPDRVPNGRPARARDLEQRGGPRERAGVEVHEGVAERAPVRHEVAHGHADADPEADDGGDERDPRVAAQQQHERRKREHRHDLSADDHLRGEGGDAAFLKEAVGWVRGDRGEQDAVGDYGVVSIS